MLINIRCHILDRNQTNVRNNIPAAYFFNMIYFYIQLLKKYLYFALMCEIFTNVFLNSKSRFFFFPLCPICFQICKIIA